ncbi:MAG: hypothetical protein E7065_10035 [Lentimicrobiaceae bacterium]|nr:hypothetical protein [Lentimicrobiaceae bacterium]
MKPIVNSQLTGKWYKITRDFHSQEFKFTEIFIYLSLNENKKKSSDNYLLDLLYVGVKEDRSKVLRKKSLRIRKKDKINYLIIRSLFFRKKFKVLLFDKDNGILILSDKRKNISIYSRRHKIEHEVLEDLLSKIKFSKSIDLMIMEF